MCVASLLKLIIFWKFEKIGVMYNFFINAFFLESKHQVHICYHRDSCVRPPKTIKEYPYEENGNTVYKSYISVFKTTRTIFFLYQEFIYLSTLPYAKPYALSLHTYSTHSH